MTDITDSAVPVPIALCVVGLGNPGARYRETRHNIGFRVIGRLRDMTDAAAPVHTTRLYDLAEVAIAGQRVLLAAPLTYMNRSGEAVALLAAAHALTPDRFLIVCDDIALPLGQIRIRRRGSAGGQNGLASVIEALDTDAVPRVRCGVGQPPPGMDAADYVLSTFLREEAEAVGALVDRAAAAVRAVLEDGIDRAMNVYNSAPPVD